MIPKKIHYCWLGNPYPPKIIHYLETWKKFLPDYTWVKWDLERLPLTTSDWVREAYENKQYAFVADYIRFYAMYQEGGIYMDTDVQVLKSFDPLLHLPYFLGQEQTSNIVESGTFGAEAGTLWVEKVFNYYEGRHFQMEDGSFDRKPLPEIMRDIFQKNFGLSFIQKPSEFDSDNSAIQLLPVEYFSPKQWQTLELHVTKNTYSIHHFAGSWLPPVPWHIQAKRIIKAKIKSILGPRLVRILKRK